MDNNDIEIVNIDDLIAEEEESYFSEDALPEYDDYFVDQEDIRAIDIRELTGE